MVQSRFSKVITNNRGRSFVVGDLHGCYDEFLNKLDEVNFNYDEDIVICTGDLVDRGNKSLDCFNLIYKNWFYTTRGNHEHFCLEYTKQKTQLDKISYKKFHINNGGDWFYQLPLDVQLHIANEIENLPLIITLNINDKSYGIVHANIPNEFKFWYDLKNELDNYKEEFDNSKLLENILYARTKAKSAMNMLSDENKFIFPDINEIYFGHTVVKFPIKRGNFNFIDTGCVFKGGELTIKEIGRDYNG